MQKARDGKGWSDLKDFIVQLRVCSPSQSSLLAPGQLCSGAGRSQHRLLLVVLATDELLDEPFQLFLIVPAGKGAGQVEHGACRAGRLLQHLGHTEGL